MQGMLTRTRLTLAGIASAAALVTGCSSDDTDTPPPSTNHAAEVAATTTTDVGPQITRAADDIAALLYQGCGDPPKLSCEASGEQVQQHAEQLRGLMEATGRDAYYRQGIAIIDRLLSASESTELRGAALDLLEWMEFHPA